MTVTFISEFNQYLSVLPASSFCRDYLQTYTYSVLSFCSISADIFSRLHLSHQAFQISQGIDFFVSLCFLRNDASGEQCRGVPNGGSHRAGLILVKKKIAFPFSSATFFSPAAVQ